MYLLTELSITKNAGPDDILARFLKDDALALAGPVTHTKSLSIVTNTVPDELKKDSNVLSQNENRSGVGKYRTVSILCNV